MTSTSTLPQLKQEFDGRDWEEAVAKLQQQLNSNHQFDKGAPRKHAGASFG